MLEECTGVRLYWSTLTKKYVKDEKPIEPISIYGQYEIVDGVVECNMMLCKYACALLGNGIRTGRCKHVEIGRGK